MVWFEEGNAFTRQDFEEGLGRLRHNAASWRQIILTTNPGGPSHWIYTDLILGGHAHVYYSGAADNTHNPLDYVETLNQLTGVLRERLALGRWVQAEGAVYPDFDPALHVLDPFEIPADWQRLRTIDFGYTNPFTCQWWALDPDGRLYLYRELYGTRRLVEDWARQIVALSAGERYRVTVADHDAEDRATLERYGVRTQAADKAVSPGIQRVVARLVKHGDGKPRLFLLRGALVQHDEALATARKPLCLADEFPSYVWPRGVDGKPDKEQPVKDNDHGMDALRYAVMYLDGKPLGVGVGKPRQRVL
jgi:phage terminase large subunit